jgi:alpha-1,3-mannosyl-glycoprotein beta-1,2-N-acetylglucosaminyltransferase
VFHSTSSIYDIMTQVSTLIGRLVIITVVVWGAGFVVLHFGFSQSFATPRPHLNRQSFLPTGTTTTGGVTVSNSGSSGSSGSITDCSEQVRDALVNNNDYVQQLVGDLRKRFEHEATLKGHMSSLETLLIKLQSTIKQMQAQQHDTTAVIAALRQITPDDLKIPSIGEPALPPVLLQPQQSRQQPQQQSSGGLFSAAASWLGGNPTPPTPSVGAGSGFVNRPRTFVSPDLSKAKLVDEANGINTVTNATAPRGTAVVIFCFNRPQSLRYTIESVLQNMPAGYTLYVSQDGMDPGVHAVIQEYRKQDKLFHLRFMFQNEWFGLIPGDKYIPTHEAYYKIAFHYKWALTQLFDELSYERVIILEDDMFVAPDFFNYFENTAPVLDSDESIWCISGWNDNGLAQRVTDPERLLRTECFPGLGWLMPLRLWEELRSKWTFGYWDDWMRLPEQRGSRSCIIPEINRVYTFGIDGASQGQFYEVLSAIKLNDVPVNFAEKDLHYLEATRYDQQLQTIIDGGTDVPLHSAYSTLSQMPPGSGDGSRTFVVRYRSLEEFDVVATAFNLMTDHKSGLPRTSYKGVVSFFTGQVQTLLPGTQPLQLPPLGSGESPTKPHFGNGYRVLMVPAPGNYLGFPSWTRA